MGIHSTLQLHHSGTTASNVFCKGIVLNGNSIALTDTKQILAQSSAVLCEGVTRYDSCPTLRVNREQTLLHHVVLKLIVADLYISCLVED
jgi:hypothetical protein